LNAGGKTGKIADKIVAMLAKITSLQAALEERRTGETPCENHHETTGNRVGRTQDATCKDESLLKACALRQEKQSLCNKNGAARHAYIGDPRRIRHRREGKRSLGLPNSSPWRAALRFSTDPENAFTMQYSSSCFA
jgi:hypothetical protein